MPVAFELKAGSCTTTSPRDQERETQTKVVLRLFLCFTCPAITVGTVI